MQIVNTGNIYRIYDNSVKTSNQLEPKSYQVEFDPRSGFFLSSYDDEIEVSEKVYGVHLEKVEKVLNSFKLFQRNLGVILSGDKGIGKSLFAKVLAEKGCELNYPLIIVNTYFPGIADFLNSIQQEVIVIFDEFDKTFSSGKNDENNSYKDPQTEMLTLFDGLGTGKKLFVVTCNKLYGLNDYLVNRPGRFHYHIRFEYPSPDEIRSYMYDKLSKSDEIKTEVEKVVSFSHKVKLNYDCLRAIAFELSLGQTFETAIQDLNIVNIEKEEYTVVIYFKDGSHVKSTCYLDFFDDSDKTIDMYDNNNYHFYVTFNPDNAKFASDRGCMVIPGFEIKIDWQAGYYYEDEEQEALKERQARECDYLALKRNGMKNLHYII